MANAKNYKVFELLGIDLDKHAQELFDAGVSAGKLRVHSPVLDKDFFVSFSYYAKGERIDNYEQKAKSRGYFFSFTIGIEGLAPVRRTS